MTRDPVRSTGKRDLIATGYRVHGDAYLPLLERRFVELGTVTNLLGDVRMRQPEGPDGDPPQKPGDRPLDGLTYSRSGRPSFDPTSKRRYDRHPSNPEAASFFSDDELGVPADRPSVKALTR